MANTASEWVLSKLEDEEHIEVLDRTSDGLLSVRWKNGYAFDVAVIGIRGTIQLSDVQPLFAGTARPQLVINVPSKTLWSGGAIRHIHAMSSAFGTFGDIARAAATGDAGSFRDKNMGFFISAMQQHSNVSSVSYVLDRVFLVERRSGAALTVAVIQSYNMSAEDVRNARNELGRFDIVVKSTSHGSITHPAAAAARSMGSEALTFGELMGRLNR